MASTSQFVLFLLLLGNQVLCQVTDDDEGGDDNTNDHLAVGLSIGILLFCCGFWIIVLLCCARALKKKKEATLNDTTKPAVVPEYGIPQAKSKDVDSLYAPETLLSVAPMLDPVVGGFDALSMPVMAAPYTYGLPTILDPVPAVPAVPTSAFIDPTRTGAMFHQVEPMVSVAPPILYEAAPPQPTFPMQAVANPIPWESYSNYGYLPPALPAVSAFAPPPAPSFSPAVIPPVGLSSMNAVTSSPLPISSTLPPVSSSQPSSLPPAAVSSSIPAINVQQPTTNMSEWSPNARDALDEATKAAPRAVAGGSPTKRPSVVPPVPYYESPTKEEADKAGVVPYYQS